MARTHEPQRVITRGKTRTIGEPRRPREGAATVGVKGEPRVSARPADRSDNGQGRFAQGGPRATEAGGNRVAREPRQVPAAEPPAAAPAPRTAAGRPLERIEALETALGQLLERFDELERAVYGEDGDPNNVGALTALGQLEEVIPKLAETVGELVETVGTLGDAERPAAGLVHAVAQLTDRVMRDTIAPPPPAPEGQPDALSEPHAED